jgi:hypothetical protein
MEPSSIYHTSKRNLAVFAGLLVLVTLGSVEIPASRETVPFIVKDPSVVQPILCVVTLYLIYQFCLSWGFQRDEIRAKYKFDFIVTLTITGITVTIYLATLRRFLSINPIFLSMLLFVSAASLALYQYTEAQRRKRDTFELRRETLSARLLRQGWVLIFNPSISDPRLGQKIISFEPDGSIGQGGNGNEHSWRMEGFELSIFRSGGELQNRFLYDEKSDRFLCTNDPLAKGTRDQVIFRIDQATL